MTQSHDVLDHLFGDMPIVSCTSEGGDAEPWLTFKKARGCLVRGDINEACAAFLSITRMQRVESRHILQAWHFLRELDRPPAHDVGMQVLGVVMEVAMERGLDVLAAYADRTVRYYNYSAAAAVWERPNASLDGSIDAVLDSARAILPHIGPWKGPRRPPPTRGNVRLNILTPAGLCFGEGPFGVLDRDPKGRPLVQAATSLMRKLTEVIRRQSPAPPTRTGLA